MTALKSLESKIQKLTAVLERTIDSGLLGTGVVTVAEEGNNTARAAAYVGKSSGTLSVWRTIEPSPGPRFSYSGTTPVYSKADLDAWLAERRATGRKRKVSDRVGRPVGSGRKRVRR
jgi:hypothetical protein